MKKNVLGIMTALFLFALLLPAARATPSSTTTAPSSFRTTPPRKAGKRSNRRTPST